MRNVVRLDRLVPTLLLVSLITALPAAALDTEERFFDSDGIQIRYIVQGQGEPVVLIHGFTASAESNWVMPGIFAKLAEGFQVIAIDTRGHGKSGKPHDPEAYGDQMVEDVVNLLDHLNIEKAHVGGYSMGGFLTMRMLATHPERMLSAVVGAAGWRPPGTEEPAMEALASSLDRGEGIGPLIEMLHPADAPPLTPEQIAGMNQMVVGTNDQAALAAVIRGMGELSVEDKALRANQVPTLAIIGSRDPLKAGVDAMVPIMSNLEVKLVEGGDHMSTLFNPQYATQLGQGIFDFLGALCKCA